METSSLDTGVGSTSPVPFPPSTVNNESTLSQFKRLSISTASGTALPLSPQVGSPSKALGSRNHPSSPNAKAVPRSPLHRSPSSASLDARSATPTTLHRKASMNSLHGVGGVTPPRSSSSRRSSSAHIINGHPVSLMGKSPLSGIDDSEPITPAMTAALIAIAHFKSELEIHGQAAESRSADTIVILHDSCYGHRYSRPRTSRAALSTIVERPERIHASVLGVSMAYVRLGQRHSEGRYHPHPKRDARDIPNIPFCIRKTTRKLALSAPAVTNVHGMRWMEELKIMCDGAETKLAVNGKELTRPEIARSPDQEPPPKLHEGDLYLCSESLDAMEGALGAVCEGVDAVFQGSINGNGPRRAFVAIRPPGHHCSASYPSGFCWLNNVHVGVAYAALTHGLTHAAIIDFDLHHGDGSQSIAWEHNTRSLHLPKNAPSWKKTSIGYFSLHDINSYPCEMGDEEKIKNASLCIENAHGQNIWNVHLQPWKNEHEFWDLYESRYSVLLEKTRAFLRSQTRRLRLLPNQVQPKAAIFLSAGFDASEWESSGMQRHKVNVPTEFYARLTRDVVKLAAEEDCAVHGRIISVLEGGYSDRALSSGVLSHISGLVGGDPIEVKKEIEQNGLGYEMAQKVGAFQTKAEAPNGSVAESLPPYDPSWWALPYLEQLDALVNPPSLPVEQKKVKEVSAPTYFSPTQSFMGKIVTAPKIRRSSSNLNGTSPGPVSRPPSPPPPEVNWAVAALELSKLLIPSDRQTGSCKVEELSAEASRARRDRQSILTPAPSTEPTQLSTTQTARMALRERRAAKPSSAAKEEVENEKPISKAGRRKTVAGDAVLAAEKATSRGTTPKLEPSYKQPTKQSTRRLSLASSTGSTASTAVPQLPSTARRTPSVGTGTIPARPGSSQSVRPGSSLSSKPQANPAVVVKKTRTVNPARSDPAKNPRASKKSPPTGLTRESSQDIPSLSRAPSSSQRPQSSTASKAANKATTGDIDSIITGMKKITINLSKAKEQAKLAAKTASENAQKKAPIQKQEDSTLPALDGLDLPPKSTFSLEDPSTLPSSYAIPESPNLSRPQILPTSQPLLPSRLAQFQDASYVPLPSSSPVISNGSSNIQTPTSPPKSITNNVSDVFVAYQPEGPPPAPIPQQEPLKWLPPNTSTPAAMKRSDLPVFSSTGAIPFGVIASKGSFTGSVGEAPGLTSKKQKPEPSIWDVPETPGR